MYLLVMRALLLMYAGCLVYIVSFLNVPKISPYTPPDLASCVCGL